MPDQQANFDTQFAPTRQDIDTQWRIEAKAMDNTWFKDKQSWQSAKSKLTAKYQLMEQKARAKLQGQVREQQQEQQAAQAEREQAQSLLRRDPGDIPREERANIQVQASTGIRRLATKQFKRLSMSEMSSSALENSIYNYAENAPGAGKMAWLKADWRDPAGRTGEGLLDAYSKWKEDMLYSEYGPFEQRQLDTVWDSIMHSDRNFRRWKNKEVQNKLKAIRGRGKGTAAIRERIVGKSPLARTIITGLSPVATAIQAGRAMMDRRRAPVQQQPQPMQQRPPVEQQEQQQIITATNPQTGRKITSSDGGKTWQ